jgi:hypothetical protein
MALGITQQKYHKNCLKIYKHREIRCRPRSSSKTLATNNSMNDLNPIGAPKIQKPTLRVRKPKGSDIEWFNPYGNQTTHFVGYIKRPNVKNSYCNRKKIKITSNVGPIICV